jgi:predicted lipoprotein with Yx(FWY)xxD motif
MISTPRRILLAALPLALVLAACGGGDASEAPSSAPAAAPSEAAPSEAAPSEAASAPAEPAGDATIVLGETTLGMVLVDAEGKTLYGFTADTDGVSTCYDTCADNWPPLAGDASATLGDGLDASLLTVVERTDGTTQLKYGDWPLYYFAADTTAGDTNGQGVGGVWFVVGADGALIGQ